MRPGAASDGDRRSICRGFSPFSASVRAVDDAPAGRASRMCRTQRIRPTSCFELAPRQQDHQGREILAAQPPEHHRCSCANGAAAAADADANGSNVRQMDTGNDPQRPRRRTFWQVLKKNCHWKCFVLSAMIDGCLATIFWCQFSQQSYSASGHSAQAGVFDYRKTPCEQGYNFIPVAFAVILYVVYIMECWHCRTRLDLLGKADVQSIYDYIDQLREALPVVWWRAVCYHYVRRTRQVTRYRNGDAVTTTQVYYERINSHTAGSVFFYQECGVKDISKKLVDLETYPVTKVRFSKGFVFANLQAANEFEEQRARFFQENEQHDDYMEVREGLDLIHLTFKENMVAFANPRRRPWFIAQTTFWLCSLLLLSWPLRILIERRTAYVNYQTTKLFGTNYLSPSSQNYTGPLTRVSTMDSGDLEAVLRNNYVVVPSYSEALLMDPVQARSAHLGQNGSLHLQTRPFRPTGVNGQSALNNYHQQQQHSRCSPLLDERLTLDDARSAMLNNERVIANYGALARDTEASRLNHLYELSDQTIDQSPLQQLLSVAQRRTRSLSLLFHRSRSSSGPFRQDSAGNGQSPLSLSFGSLAALARASNRKPYRTLPTTPDAEIGPLADVLDPDADEDPLDGVGVGGHHHHHRRHYAHDQPPLPAPEEPPPPYDLALKLCPPVAAYATAMSSVSGSKFKWLTNLTAGKTAVVVAQRDVAGDRSDTVL